MSVLVRGRIFTTLGFVVLMAGLLLSPVSSTAQMGNKKQDSDWHGGKKEFDGDGAEHFGCLGTITLIEGDQSAVPGHFILEPNYPNPFNPGTTIPFSIGAPTAPVLLSIYNTAGQRIRTLVDGSFASGRHQIFWGGRDDTGTSVAAGLYIYALRSGAFSQQRKMLLADRGGSGGGEGTGKVAIQAISFSVEMTAEHILDRQQLVNIDGAQRIDFQVDERFPRTRRVPMPMLRQEIAAATLDHRIYVFGGLDDKAQSIDVVGGCTIAGLSRHGGGRAVRPLTTAQYDKLPIAVQYLTVAEQSLQLGVIGEVPVADDEQLPPGTQHSSRAAEHAPRRGISHGAVLMEGRIAQNEVDTIRRKGRHAVPRLEFRRTTRTENLLPVVLRRGDRREGFVDELQLRPRIALCRHQADNTVAAAQIDDLLCCIGNGNVCQQLPRTDIETLPGEQTGVVRQRPVRPIELIL